MFVLPFLLLAACEPQRHPGGPPAGEEAPRPALAVTVQDDEGAPVPAAWVSLSPGGRDTQAGADGVARYARLVPGTYTATAWAPGTVPASATVEVTADASLSLVLPTNPAGTGSLAGLVAAPGDGAPGVPGATVLIDGAPAATTDADGAWQAWGLAPGRHTLRVEPPAGSTLRAWWSEAVDVAAGGGARVGLTLPGGPPADATFVGSAACAACHAAETARHGESAHARPTRTVEELAATGPRGLVAAFEDGQVVSLDPLVPGATVALSVGGDDAWRAEVRDASGASTGAHVVAEVYGGHATAFAFALDFDGVWVTLPLGYGLGGGGASPDDGPGWVPAWTEGWFDATGALTLGGDGRPDPAADFDRACGGCHATGHRLVEEGAHVRLGDAGGTMERAVGCESCHGAGSAHVQAAEAGEPSAALTLDPADLPASARLDACGRCHTRTTTDDPFVSPAPAWPTDADGVALGPDVLLDALTTPAPLRWTALVASRLHRDQGGDLSVSRHRAGPDGYQGACEDCHDAHGSTTTSGLREAPTDAALCTTCHGGAFPDEAAVATHAGHLSYHPDAWSPGGCPSCHLSRGPVVLRVDGLSGAGEGHGHSLFAWSPELAVAEFDAVGAEELPLGEAPVAACLDCHLQADALAAQAGTGCPCPSDDPTWRQTHVDLAYIYEQLFGGTR